MKKRIVLVDDHVALRQMLSRMLTLEKDYDVVGEGGTGFEALEICQRTQPDLMILDLGLPELCGTEVLRRVRGVSHDLRVLIYSGLPNQIQVVEALKLRPHGFVDKTEPWATLREALRVIAMGGAYFTARASGLLNTARDGECHHLTRREHEVLQLVAESRSTKEIASRLGLAVKTVEHHRERLKQKLHLHDVAGLTRYAVRTGVVA